jgi:sulfatase maturation enzyme AslB (radical SAM superfamily)
MFDGIPKKFDYKIKRLFGKDIKVIINCCNRVDMSCCGGGGGGGCCMSLFLHVNNYCNANCYFCIADNDGKKRSEISDFKKLERVVDELIAQQVISKVVLTGGEPTMHPRFEDFLSMLDRKELMWYSLNTNGILLNRHIEAINSSKLRHINISMHHFTDETNKKIMGNCISFEEVKKLRQRISDNKEMRLACTITEDCYTEKDIMAYIDRAKSIGINNVIFRNEYNGFNKHLYAFRKIWGKLFTADICNCGYKLISGVNSEYRESNIRLKQTICSANTYFRDFIYKDDDILSGSWEYCSQPIY